MKLYLSLVTLLLLFIGCKEDLASKTGGQIQNRTKVKEGRPENLSGPHPVVYKTKTGKSVKLITHHNNKGLNDIKIVPLDFQNSEDTFSILSAAPLELVIIEDLDKNGYDEIYLITAAAGSGSYAQIHAYASNQDLSLTPVYVPEVRENDLKPEGNFYGYMGHDSIYISDKRLYRKFPVYMKGDANCCPTGGYKTLHYSLKPGEAGWLLDIEK